MGVVVVEATRGTSMQSRTYAVANDIQEPHRITNGRPQEDGSMSRTKPLVVYGIYISE